MNQPLDPNDPNLQQKIAALMSGGSATAPPGPRWNGGLLDPVTGLPMGTAAPQTPAVGATPEVSPKGPGMPTTTAGDPLATPAASSGYDTTGLDPSNPTDAVFIKNKYKQGGAGSGFGDLAAWRNYNQPSRLDADQLGTGTDMPGPGDAGNTSRDPNFGKSTAGAGGFGAGGGLTNPLSLLPGMGLPTLSGSDPADSILSRIMTLLNQFGGG